MTETHTYMDVLFDLHMKDGSKIERCYFVQYEEEILGPDGIVFGYFMGDVKCFDENDQEIKGFNVEDIDTFKVYDRKANKDISTVFADMLESRKRWTNILGTRIVDTSFPLATRVVRAI